MRKILIENCWECSYSHDDNGGGHCEPFVRCAKFNFLILDDNTDLWFDWRHKIHPNCKLKKAKEKC